MTMRPDRDLREGIDFYREGPYLVFTAEYLRARGYCCDSGCRHCPWRGEDEASDDPNADTLSPQESD